MHVTGAILAGGAGRRIGGDKALVPLEGEPLLLHVLRPLLAACGEPVGVLVKPGMPLPPLPPGAERWDEPAAPRHPLTGIRAALERTGGPVLACAVDLPRMTARVLSDLIAAAPERLAVPLVDGRREPACALWTPAALPVLAAAADDARLRDVVAALDPVEVPADPAAFRNVNTRADLSRT